VTVDKIRLDRFGLLKEALIDHGTAFDGILDLREIRRCFINKSYGM
jgi:hypothetical protein